jgi:hypothetical protein
LVVGVVDKYRNPQSNICGGATTDWMVRRASVRSNFARRAQCVGHRVLLVPGHRTALFRSAASQRISCGDRAAPPMLAPRIVRHHSIDVAFFAGKKCRRENATLQLSSYVVGLRVFHMMRRRFAQIFVASKALNHLQLSLTIARIC